jgi:hypothetical protein
MTAGHQDEVHQAIKSSDREADKLRLPTAAWYQFATQQISRSPRCKQPVPCRLPMLSYNPAMIANLFTMQITTTPEPGPAVFHQHLCVLVKVPATRPGIRHTSYYLQTTSGRSMETRTQAHAHARTHSLTHMHPHARIHTLTYARTHACTHAGTHSGTHARTHSHMHARTHALQ